MYFYIDEKGAVAAHYYWPTEAENSGASAWWLGNFFTFFLNKIFLFCFRSLPF